MYLCGVTIEHHSNHVTASCTAFDITIDAPDVETAVRTIKKKIVDTGASLIRENKALPPEVAFQEMGEGKSSFYFEVDFNKTVKERATRAVRRTITLPEWMDLEIREKRIDSSKLFQKAYMDTYGTETTASITSISDLEREVDPKILQEYVRKTINEKLKEG